MNYRKSGPMTLIDMFRKISQMFPKYLRHVIITVHTHSKPTSGSNNRIRSCPSEAVTTSRNERMLQILAVFLFLMWVLITGVYPIHSNSLS